VDDWVQEGFRVLAEDSVKALTLGRLCSRLGVTKGSFYWHFSDMKAYREALIGSWAADRDSHIQGVLRCSAVTVPARVNGCHT
jgi:AcrR family transcriptional regulator